MGLTVSNFLASTVGVRGVGYRALRDPAARTTEYTIAVVPGLWSTIL